MKWALPVGIVLLLSFTIIHFILKRAGAHEIAEAQARAAQSRLDLSNMPEPTSRPTEPPPKPKRVSGKPVMVELDIRPKNGKRMLSAPYRVINAAGEVVSEEATPPPGETVVLILSPGEYELQIPARKFKQAFTVSYGDGEKKNVKVRVR